MRYEHDFTKEDRSKTWQYWWDINREIYDLYRQSYIPVTPKPGGFTMGNGEFVPYGHVDRNCISCKESFPAHYEHQVLCSSCFANYHMEFLYYSDLKLKATLPYYTNKEVFDKNGQYLLKLK